MTAPAIDLVEMTRDELAAWLPGAIERTIAARVDAGESASRATSLVTTQRDTSFPDGLPAPGHQALRVLADGEHAGAVWLSPGYAPESQERYLFVIELDEDGRDGEFAPAVLHAVERRIAEDGARRLSVTVVGPDVRVQAQLELLGYVVAATAMYKGLE